MSDFDAFLRESLELWPAWTVLVKHLSREDPKTVDPQSMYGSMLAADYPRLVSLLYAHGHGDTLGESEDMLRILFIRAKHGNRPLYGRETLT